MNLFINDILLHNSVIRLRPIRKDDIIKLADIALELNIWTYFAYKIADFTELKAYIEDALEQQKSALRYTFVIEEVVTGNVAGSTALGNYSEKDQRIEIGWSWLGTQFQGRGVNKNTKFLLLCFAFEHLGLERVEFKTDVLNQKARQGLIKIGAKEEGILRSHMLMPGGRRRDTVYYSILREEWPHLRATLFSDYSSLVVS